MLFSSKELLSLTIILNYDGGVSDGQQKGVARSPPQKRRGNSSGDAFENIVAAVLIC